MTSKVRHRCGPQQHSSERRGATVISDSVRASLDKAFATHSRWDEEVLSACIRYHEQTAPQAESRTVLDLGCGFGQLLPMLSTRFDTVLARDPDDEGIRLAAALVSTGSHPMWYDIPAIPATAVFDVKVGSNKYLECEDNSIDCIIAASSAQQWDWTDAAQVYTTLGRALKSGGSLIIIGSKPVAGRFEGHTTSTPALTRLTADVAAALQGDLEMPRFGAARLFSDLPQPWQVNVESDWDEMSFRYWVFGPATAVNVEVAAACHEAPLWMSERLARRLVLSVHSDSSFTEGLPKWTPMAIAAWVREIELPVY